MKKHLIAYSLLGLAVLALLMVASDASVRRHQAAQAAQQTENAHLLSAQEHLQAITLQLDKAPAAGEARQTLLWQASLHAAQAAQDLSALPLAQDARSAAVAFCNRLSREVMQDGPLEELRAQAALLSGQLAAAQTSGSDLQSLAAFDAIPAPAPAAPKGLGENWIDQQQAIAIARDFVGESRVRSASPGTPAGGVLESWGVTITLTDGSILNADVTRRGGRMLWMMPEEAGYEARLTPQECSLRAETFLQDHGYGQMETTDVQCYSGMAVIGLAAVEDGVLLYPDHLRLQLRMDTGEVVGLESSDYLMNHAPRGALAPAVSREEIIRRLTLQPSGLRLCVLPHDGGEKLCWEARVRWQENEYLVYLDAQTGEEIHVVMLMEGQNGKITA